MPSRSHQSEERCLALRGILFSIDPIDLPTLIAASAVVLAAALGATIAPLVVATRVEPRVALEE